MLGILLHAGYEPTQAEDEADYLVVNTCGFLKAAREEGAGEIDHLLATKKVNSKLIVTGCMVNLHKEEILEQYPGIDQVLGAGSIHKILDAVRGTQVNEEEGSGKSAKSFLEDGEVPRLVATPPHYAYLKVAEGCRKRCSFCIIPSIKGPLKSKPPEQVVQECNALLKNGASEIILIAQDLGDYGKDWKDPNGLARLLRQILDSTEQDFWLRLMYLYPDEITPDVVEILESDSRVCRYLDMPIQHINNKILKRMRRKTTGDDIRQTIELLRTRLPDVHIRTSLMVGFPGETDEQFEELLEFVVSAQLENVGVFQYSDEELAVSSRLDDKVPEDVKQDRFDRLMEAQLQIVRAKNQQRVDEGQVLDVVLEGQHKDRLDCLVGRYFGQCPDIDGQVIVEGAIQNGRHPELGKRHRIKISGYNDYDLIGQVLERS